MSKTLSQEIIAPHAYFLSWSLSTIHIIYPAPVSLNKRTHRACGQPHGLRFARRLGV
jgi:hypothetical protein